MNQTIKYPVLTRATTAIIGRMNLLICLLLNSLLELLSLTKSRNKIWIIGENRGECLKENGYWFYKYCRKHYPDQEVYFIVKKISPYFKQERDRDQNIIPYGSIRHAQVFINSSICLYTHTYRDVMYRRFYELFGKKKKLVYLHHGVLGYKKFDSFYHKKRNIMHLFTVGSLLEKDILVRQEHVDEDRVKVTGYARYDYFGNKASKDRFQIVFMPTHRNYVKGTNKELFFLNKIQNAINNRQLHSLIKQHNILFKVYLHKEFQRYSDVLRSSCDNIKIIKLGEETPQELISASHLMITDYSSVSWDFLYLGKPIIFYRFDIESYLEDRDSYINLYEETIGDIAFDEECLIEKIGYYIQNSFTMKDKFKNYREKIIPNLDKNNCRRIYDETVALASGY